MLMVTPSAMLFQDEKTSSKRVDIVHIANQNALSNLIESIEAAPESALLALDTEFERRSTFYPKPALLQLAFDEHIFLIDVLEFKSLDDLFKALQHKTIVMHACREDMEVFRELSQYRLTTIADTQVAAALLGYETQLSYQRLVEQVTAQTLEKNETCSDWLQRPLSADQIHYAADDVRFLVQIFTQFEHQLTQKNRIDWFWQEMEFIKENLEEPKPEDYFSRMKGLGRFSEKALGAAYDLVLWREHLAREKNIPRGFIIKDKGLLHIIRHYASGSVYTVNNLFNLEDVPAVFVKRYGGDVLDLIKQSELTDEKAKAIKQVLWQAPFESKSFANKLKHKRDALCKELDISQETLLPNRLLNALVVSIFNEGNSSDFAHTLKPWREHLLSESIQKALQV